MQGAKKRERGEGGIPFLFFLVLGENEGSAKNGPRVFGAKEEEKWVFLSPPLFLAIYYAAPSASAAAVPFKWSGILFLAIFKRDPGMFSPLYPPPDPFLCIASIFDKSAQKRERNNNRSGD